MAQSNGSTINHLEDALRLTRFLWHHPKDLRSSSPAELAEIVAHAGEKLDPELQSTEFWLHLHKWVATAHHLKTQHPHDREVEKNHVARGAVGAMSCPIIYDIAPAPRPHSATAAEDPTASSAPTPSGWHAVIFALLRQSLDSVGADNPHISEILWALAKSLSDNGKTDPRPDKIVALISRLHPA